VKLPKSLQWRIAIAYTVLIFATMGAVSLYLVTFIRNSYIQTLDERLAQEAAMAVDAVDDYFTTSLDTATLRTLVVRLGSAARAQVTVVDVDGRILADSSEGAQTSEVLLTRAEIRDAITLGLGSDVRPDPETNEEIRYAAAAVVMGGETVGAVRVAAPTSEIQGNVNRIVTTIGISAGVVALLSVALGYYIARRTSRSVHSVTSGARRLAEGDLEHRVTAFGTDETRDLAEAFNKMASRIRDVVRDLDSERDRLSAVLDTMADGVLVVDPDGVVVLMNRSAADLLAVKAAAMGSRFAQTVRDHDLQRLVSAAHERKAVTQSEVALLPSRRVVSAMATPLSEGSTQGVLLTLHDRTETRRLEETRKEFVTNASHELRSPLASIKAMVETLEGGASADPSVASDYLGRVHREVDRMTALVTDLLELSRLESGQLRLQQRTLDPKALVEETLSRVQERARAAEITLESAVSKDTPPVLGDEQRLVQALFNLVDNALKYTLKSGRVTVAARVEGKFINFSVTDNGTGIAPEDLPHIFERFYKADRARRDGGTGLGLAIVKHTAQVHGGGVSIDSRLGVGTTVAFTVPLA
jgi:two-component system phosphate regulon sensor histidine kinase PhoR